jgi:hypothetical protein
MHPPINSVVLVCVFIEKKSSTCVVVDQTVVLIVGSRLNNLHGSAPDARVGLIERRLKS